MGWKQNGPLLDIIIYKQCTTKRKSGRSSNKGEQLPSLDCCNDNDYAPKSQQARELISLEMAEHLMRDKYCRRWRLE